MQLVKTLTKDLCSIESLNMIQDQNEREKYH